MALRFGAAVIAVAASPAWAGRTELVSVGLHDAPAGGGDLGSIFPTISADGRLVSFESDASNLVPGDTNGVNDIFVRDRQAGTTERVSVADDGSQADGYSTEATLSASGRYVVFLSSATNLVPGGTNGKGQIYVRDRQAGTTVLASVSSGGARANDDCYSPEISADGRHVIFYSSATNLVRGDSNGQQDVFLRDLEARTTERVSLSSDGAQANGYSYNGGISSNGRYVTFWSAASNLVKGDTNRKEDVFLRDRRAGTTTRLSVSSAGAQANGGSSVGWISGDGRYVVFQSDASNLVRGDTNGETDVFLRDRQTGRTERVSLGRNGRQGNKASLIDWGGRVITPDGRYVSFYSYATNLVPGDTNGSLDVLVRDRVSRVTARASVSSTGTQGNSNSYDASISGTEGRFVAFHSTASNLVPGDTNGEHDIFVHVR